jgi:hypothetical protein
VSTAQQEPPTLERIRKLRDELVAAYEELLAGKAIAARAHISAIVAEWAADVVPAIDARIARCHELVRRGLRTEALGYAAEPPDLFQAARLLDLERFEEYGTWAEASRTAGLALPPTPQLENLAAIEQAAERVDELRPLLERWRRMNIQRAPLPSRIRMLRELCAADPVSDVWRTSLADHESYRLMEIRAHVGRLRERFTRQRDATAAGIEPEVEQYVAELGGEWTTLTPPAGLVEQATALAADVRQRRIDDRLDQLAAEIGAAHALLDTDRRAAREQLVQLHDSWNATLADRGVIDPADPRLSRVGGICEYVARFTEHDALMSEVALRLAERPPAYAARLAWSTDLDRMMDRIDDTASRLPAMDVDSGRIAELSDRVADVAEAVRREAFFRRLTRGTGVAAALLLVAVASWAAYAFRRHGEAVRAAVAETTKAIETLSAGGDAAADLGVAWSDAVRGDPAVMAASEKVKAARLARDERRQSLARRLDDVRAVLDELRTAARNDPLTPWPEQFTRAARLLADTKRENLAVVDEERAQLEPPAAVLRAKAKEFTDAADVAFGDRVRRLQADLIELESILADDPAAADRGISQATQDLETLRKLTATAACPGAGEDYDRRKLVSAIEATLVANDSKLAAKVTALRERRAVFAGLAGREEKADRLLAEGKYPQYADAIRAIAKDAGPGPLARDYGDVAANHAAWQALADWSLFVTAVSASSRPTAHTAGQLLEKLKSLPPEVWQLPDAQEARRWMEPWLERVTSLTQEKLDQFHHECDLLFASHFGEQLDGVVAVKGEPEVSHGGTGVGNYPRYYCLLKDRPLPREKKGFRHVTDLPDANRDWPFKTKEFDPETHVVGDAPQKRLVDAARKILDLEAAKDATRIDPLVIKLVLTCAEPTKPAAGELAVDPLLQAPLLRFLVEYACKASPAVAAGFSRSLASINAGNDKAGNKILVKRVNNASYGMALDPDRQESVQVDRDRQTCEAFVATVVSDLREVEQRLKEDAAALDAHLHGLRTIRLVGRLRKSATGGFTISGGDASARSGRQVYTVGGVQEGFQMLPCATCDEAGAIAPGTDVKARAGEPLYVIETVKKKGT